MLNATSPIHTASRVLARRFDRHVILSGRRPAQVRPALWAARSSGHFFWRAARDSYRKAEMTIEKYARTFFGGRGHARSRAISKRGAILPRVIITSRPSPLFVSRARNCTMHAHSEVSPWTVNELESSLGTVGVSPRR